MSFALVPFAKLLFSLVAMHFALDYPLQGDTTAIQKNPKTDNALAKAVPWYYWMYGAFTTGTWLYPIQSMCKGTITIHQDQDLHLLFEVVYALDAGWLHVAPW